MLVWENPAQIGEWIRSRKGGNLAPGTFSAIGWVSGGDLKAAIAFSDSNGKNCQASIAVDHTFLPPSLLKAGLFYAYKQLALRRLTFMVSHANIRSQNLVTRLGAKREATLQEADEDGGDLLIYVLFPENCRIWSRING
jgi:hypothetical protein